MTALLEYPETLPAAPSAVVGELLPARGEHGAPVLDVVVPVYCEERALGPCVETLRAYLTAHLPYPSRITIVDNASTDATWQVARRLRESTEGVAALRLPLKGRGRALRAAWSASDAEVLAYMDVDLSTDLAAVLPLVAPLLSGHSDLAIGTRLRTSSRVVRGPKRSAISKSYNLLLHSTMGVHFSDAQCGFKAIRADVAAALLPLVRDEEWFFDTELLVLAERSGLRIYEVPVDWVDDPDSRVDLVDTARKDLQGMWRVLRGLHSGRLALGDVRAAFGRGLPPNHPQAALRGRSACLQPGFRLAAEAGDVDEERRRRTRARGPVAERNHR